MYIEYERYWNDGSPSGFTYESYVSDQYSPLSLQDSYTLPIHMIPRNECTQVGEIPGEWAQEITPSGHVPIPIHPDVKSDIEEVIPSLKNNNSSALINVVPTASGRTVLWHGKGMNSHFLKLHYPRRLGRFVRDLYHHKWFSSLEVSREIQASSNHFPLKFAYLRESAGTFIESKTPNKGFGVIYRELHPFPSSDAHGTYLVPAFSLFSNRRPEEASRPLLLDILDW